MKYVALFRGLNVGGNNPVKMVDLKKLFAGLGLRSVQTYIQSGNVLFESAKEQPQLKDKIEREFEAAFGFPSVVTLRTEAQLAALLSGVPFSPEELSEAERAAAGAVCLYCYLLDAAASLETVSALCAAYDGKDRIVASGREIYLLCYQSIRESKLATSLSKLKAPMTARNMKTLNRLYRFMQTM